MKLGDNQAKEKIMKIESTLFFFKRLCMTFLRSFFSVFKSKFSLTVLIEN